MSSILRYLVIFYLFNFAKSASTSDVALITSHANRGSLRGTESILVSPSENHGDLTYAALWSENQPDISNKHSDEAEPLLFRVQENPTVQPGTTDSYVNTVSSSAALIGQSCNLEMRWTIKSYWQEGEFIGYPGYGDIIRELILTNIVDK